MAPLQDDLVDAQTGAIDSDEEKDAVMAAMSRAAPRPLFEKPVISARAKYNHVRMKEMLSNALGGNRGAGLFATAPRAGSSAVAADGAVWPPLEGEAETAAAMRRMSGVGTQNARRGSLGAGVQAW